MSKIQKLCADCQHLRIHPQQKRHGALCGSAAFEPNLVTGDPQQNCEIQRSRPDGKCGVDGKLFEQRDPSTWVSWLSRPSVLLEAGYTLQERRNMESVPNSMRLHIRGLHIDAQCGKGGVVNLVVRADQEHKGAWGRFRQHIANAFFRAGDACHPSNNHGGLRVILRDMARAAGNDCLPQFTDADIRQVWPLHTANGDAHYLALLAHEGVKRHHDGRAAARKARDFGGQKSTYDAHCPSPSKTVILALPQGHGKTTLAADMAKQLGCTTVIDEWSLSKPLTPGALHLTNEVIWEVGAA